MRLKSIHLKNFLSFGKVDVNLVEEYDEPPTIYVIDGINYDNDSSDSSNGSGKSAFISESIMFNIFGKGLRGSKQKVKAGEMIRHGANEMLNSIEYFIAEDNDNQVLNIKRHKSNKSSSTEILIDNENKTKRLKRLSDLDIRSFIDLEPELFTQIVVYYRDNTNLLSMNYGQRADMFKKMINLKLIDDYYENSKQFKNTNEKYLEYLKLLKKNTKDIIEVIDSNKDKYEEYLKNEISGVEKELETECSKTFISIEEDEKRITELEKELKNVDKQIKDISDDIIVRKRDIEKIDNEINKIKKVTGGKCPTCKQFVDNSYTAEIEKEYNMMKEVLLSEIQTFVKDSEKLSNIKLNLKDNIQTLKDTIKEVDAEKLIQKQNISNLNKRLNKLNIDLTNMQEDKIDSSEKNKYEKKLVAIDKAIKIRNEWKNASEYWYNLFAPKSLLRSVIIRKYVVILSDIFEYYVSKLYNSEIIGKIEIDDDSNIDIILYKDKYETNYWQMSSGERKRVDIAMLLSLYEFTSYIKPNMPKFLILDEIFDSLDAPGISSVLDTLIDVQNRHNIDLFLISHIAIPINTTNLNVKNILVSKKDKISAAKILERN